MLAKHALLLTVTSTRIPKQCYFWNRVLLCCPILPRILGSSDHSTSASQKYLGVQMCASTPVLVVFFFNSNMHIKWTHVYALKNNWKMITYHQVKKNGQYFRSLTFATCSSQTEAFSSRSCLYFCHFLPSACNATICILKFRLACDWVQD